MRSTPRRAEGKVSTWNVYGCFVAERDRGGGRLGLVSKDSIFLSFGKERRVLRNPDARDGSFVTPVVRVRMEIGRSRAWRRGFFGAPGSLAEARPSLLRPKVPSSTCREPCGACRSSTFGGGPHGRAPNGRAHPENDAERCGSACGRWHAYKIPIRPRPVTSAATRLSWLRNKRRSASPPTSVSFWT